MTNPSSRPNVLFILSDQHNAKVLGHKDHPDVKTPCLDRLASEGVRFDNAVTQNPICTPSRVSWLSGQYCHNHGYYGLSGPNPGGLPTLLGHFRRHGYTTSAVGKIHCPEYWVEDDAENFHETCNCSIGGRSAKYTQFLQDRGKLELEDHLLMPEFGETGRQSMEGRPSPLSFQEAQEGWIAHETIRFMKEAVGQGKPFLAHASLPRPHQCTAPSEPFWSMYEGVDLTLPPNADYPMEGKAPHLNEAAEGWRKGEWTLLDPKTFEAGRLRKLRGYLGAVSQVDHAVGVMLDALAEMGIAENTIVVYSSDHGDYACEHGIMEKAPGICSDAITRVPSLWRWPGQFQAGHVAEELVESVDFATTVCKLAGLPELLTADGKDIGPLLRGGSGEVRSIAVTEFAWSRSVRKGRYRLVYYPPEQFHEDYPEGFGELYDLQEDPWEMTNHYFDPAYADVVREIQRDLLDWLVTTTRPKTLLTKSEPDPPTDQLLHRYHHAVCKDGCFPSDWVGARTGIKYL